MVAQRRTLTLLTMSILLEKSLQTARQEQVKHISEMIPDGFNGLIDIDVLNERLAELKKEETDSLKRVEDIEKKFDAEIGKNESSRRLDMADIINEAIFEVSQKRQAAAAAKADTVKSVKPAKAKRGEAVKADNEL